jgi:concentrative nucleoside transporter, CNT family
MGVLNLLSFLGMFGLCAIAWLFSEKRDLKGFPWRVVLMGIALQLVLGAFVFSVPGTRDVFQVFSNLLNSVFEAADTGARFVFGRNIVPLPGQEPNSNLGYIFAFRALPTVIFFSGFMALLQNLGIIQAITNVFAKVFYTTMRLSGAEALSGAANIFVGIEAAIVVKPYLSKMTRSELCAILACCFGTAASSTLAIYVSFLRPVFPNILGHLVSASIMAIPACFLLSKILVPETEMPITLGKIPQAEKESQERISPLDAAIAGALDGVKMAVSIAAVLILILGLVSLVNQIFGGLAQLPGPWGDFFKVVTLTNIQGALFLPLTFLTGVSLDWNELWESSVMIGRRLFETAIPSYQALAAAAARPEHPLSDRALLIISYALSGFAHLASMGIFVGGTIALIPSRRKDIADLGWKALFVGTLATMMIACVAGVFDTGNISILGRVPSPVPPIPLASPVPTPIPAQGAKTRPTLQPTTSPALLPVPATPAAPQPRATAKPAVKPGQKR